MIERGCPFCDPPKVLFENSLAVAIPDKYPVREGHTLVIPRRHVSSFFELTDEEALACYDLIKRVRESLDGRLSPGGYKVGVNIGRASGQSVMHVHIHVLPMGGKKLSDRNELFPGRGG
jgi:diadenosine tetraphosphate (Ap4A) HIT family hydrolase